MKTERTAVIYMVEYLDDVNQKHITFVEGFSGVRFLEYIFGCVHYEVTENYVRTEHED